MAMLGMATVGLWKQFSANLSNYLKLALKSAAGGLINTVESFQHSLHPASICRFSGPQSNHFIFLTSNSERIPFISNTKQILLN